MDRKNKYVCPNTNDYMFLLSVKEAYTYFKSDEERQTKGTAHAIKNGLYVDDGRYGSDGKGYSYWWLRSPYYDNGNSARSVSHNGLIYNYYVGSTDYGVRVACWINH